jgi:hypothetical protein
MRVSWINFGVVAQMTCRALWPSVSTRWPPFGYLLPCECHSLQKSFSVVILLLWTSFSGHISLEYICNIAQSLLASGQTTYHLQALCFDALLMVMFSYYLISIVTPVAATSSRSQLRSSSHGMFNKPRTCTRYVRQIYLHGCWVNWMAVDRH